MLVGYRALSGLRRVARYFAVVLPTGRTYGTLLMMPTDEELGAQAPAAGVDPSTSPDDLRRHFGPTPPEPHSDRAAHFDEVRRRSPFRISVDSSADGEEDITLCELQINDGPWWAAAELRLYEHRLLVTDVTVFPGGRREDREGYDVGEWSGDVRQVPTGGIPHGILREVRPALFVDYAYAWADWVCRVAPTKWAMDLMYSLPDLRTDAGTGSPEVELARLAARWVDKSTSSRSPTKDIAAEDGVPWEQVRDRIYRARQQGLLSGGAPGRVDGGLTERARRLLAGTDSTSVSPAAAPPTRRRSTPMSG